MNSYTYRFNPFGERFASCIRIDHQTLKKTTFDIKLDDDQILHFAGRQVTPLVADLMDLASAVLLADHSSPRTEHQCRINISLHIRNTALFNNPHVIKSLHSLLYHFTNDDWHFEFQPHSNDRRIAEQQMRMPKFARTDGLRKVRVALFSGGLDALGGLAHQILDHPKASFSLISVGTDNTRMQNAQENLAGALKSSVFGNRIHHVLVNTPRRYKKRFPKNPDFRVRAFAFLLIGAAYALLEDQTTLYVFENGIGAINMPFQASEVGLDHSRAVHPVTLQLMQTFISEITAKKFLIENPFLFQTKVEICEGIRRAGLSELIPQTITCDRIGRDAHQCGTCSSCLLRRQALAFLGLPDAPYSMQKSGTYLRHMLRQVEILKQVLDTEDSWVELARRYPTFIMDLDQVHANLGLFRESLHRSILALYERYIDEWDCVRHLFDSEMGHGIQ